MSFTAIRYRRPWLCALGLVTASLAAAAAPEPGRNYGPYDLTILEGGIGLSRPLSEDAPLLAANAPWSIHGWLNPGVTAPGEALVAAIGDVAAGPWRGLVLADGRIGARLDDGTVVTGGDALSPGRWIAVAASYDGLAVHLYLNGRPVADRTAKTLRVAPRLELAPVTGNPSARPHFAGSMTQLRLSDQAESSDAVRSFSASPPDFSLVHFTDVGVGWPFQEHAWRGLLVPQDPWTLPRSATPPDAPVAAPVNDAPALQQVADQQWTVGRWRLRAAPLVSADGAGLSQSGYDDHDWYPAVVPGTVLTTLIARGVYPDPDHGLNNLAIPETLARQDYWYRSEFDTPAHLDGRQVRVRFKGINYAAEVWLNGVRLGRIEGAFTRGTFEVTPLLRPDRPNALAVRISPPPHPGIPHEESIAAGPGENGGNLALDGPTFIAAEGWDWIPGIRDRNSGIWQEVELQASGALRLLDPQVTTHLPLPRTDSADVRLVVPIDNHGTTPVAATVTAQFDQVSVRRDLLLPPGVTEVRFDPQEFPQLHLDHPRLWWPNGYGAADLHELTLRVSAGPALSDTSRLRFGIRELTYELSLFDHTGALRRVEVDPAAGSLRGERLVDGRHQAIKRTPQGWAQSLTAAGETSPAVRPATSVALSPYLRILVNGVPIAARGGSWGMDDSRKRVSRAHLEPFFELHREAHLNIIRNWLGQDTEDVFYDLADEYGLLVLNDFWVSTQDFQLEPQDPALFLANARDVISRYRNHPSIAVWFGRNEGVPPPILNEGLADLVAALDGTRWYTGSSNSVNLQGSGPYNYRPPVQYYGELARGFSVEVGTPSLATLESLQAMIPESERWPLSDTIAYHDWHFGGNGDVASFMAALSAAYGAADSLPDFERKAQLMNYVSYRAIFEGFAAHLWTQNSGRLLWMTHPAWPSNHWQIYTADYDTPAAYYGVKKACEPLHAQMNLPDFALTVVNTTRTARTGLVLRSRVLALDGRTLATGASQVNVAADAITTLAPLALAPLLERESLVLVQLQLSDASGAPLSENVYWQARDAAAEHLLNGLAPQRIELGAQARRDGTDRIIDVRLRNPGSTPALTVKLTALDALGRRVLPAYYSDNYVALMPGESRLIQIRCPAGGERCARLALRGWNVETVDTVIAAPGEH